MITTPARAFELRNSEYDWGYKATMIKRPDYERVEKPHTRGKVLGGCSALNYFTWSVLMLEINAHPDLEFPG
jgi:choline dehydrogenase